MTRGVALVSVLLAACGGRAMSESGQPAQAHPAGSGGADSGTGNGGDTEAGNGGTAPEAGGGGEAGTPSDAGGGSTGCAPLAPIPRRLWRLSAEQWGNAVQSLLDLQSPPVLTSLGGEAPFAPFSDASLTVDDSMLFDLYLQASAATAQIDSTVATTIAPCAGTTDADQTSCALSFIQGFAARAYRRPITPEELSDLMTVYEDGATDGYNAGIELAIRAVVTSPSFLFRTELGPTTLTADANGNYPDTTLTPDEVASQLSFTLLGTIPDAPLTAAARDGSLATKDGIAAQINRLIALPAAQTYLTGNVLRWLGVGQVFEKTKDPALLSGSDGDVSAIQNDLWASAQQLVSSILWSGSGKINDLLTSQTVYVNRRLAALYPDAIVPQPLTNDTTFVAATWPASQARSGMLTDPSYLWALSDPSATSIVKRGKAIHDDVVCQDPLGAPVDLTQLGAMNVIDCKSPDGTQTLSSCDSEVLRSDARLAFEPCQSCHVQMDPYARVLQHFDAIGNYRTVDEAGRTIDASATFSAEVSVSVPGDPTPISAPGSPLAPQMVTGAQGLASALISTRAFEGCAAQQIVSAAIGSQIQSHDTCELEPLRAAEDGTIQSLLVNALLADFVRVRAGGPK